MRTLSYNNGILIVKLENNGMHWIIMKQIGQNHGKVDKTMLQK